MSFGVIRWYVPDALELEAATKVESEMNALGLNPERWSSRTLILTFPDDPALAKGKFNDVQAWLAQYFASSQKQFRAICSGANAFCDV